MLRPLWLLTAITLLVGVMVLPGHAQPREPRKVDPLMKRKLTAAQKVLEGISLGEFDLIRRNAEELSDLSTQVGWRVLKTPEYERFSAQFRQATGDLARQARARNVNAAALAYVELTLVCVRCHQYVRDTRKVSADELLPLR